ncbi:DNA polymerase III subunit chi [Rhodoblastus sp. 17X3]|uniref:DNA polymerase III subunit chi n=1 Tax=Rhodoblastus sp. 17X3 TaxID=3047026 RepID=UPI0024B6D189|nr:DNA polymerase III subunit chi [Rhodoblastus sp. 17X3]MDI9847192.1 DNA polymerase III subunit chi [Rhodoblastus sp. 17X3]
MAEFWFYQLQKRTLEEALPALVELALKRGWRAVVQARTPEYMAAIDDLLWTYDDEAFLPHGSQAEGDPVLQAVWLSCGQDNPNGAQIRFLIEGAEAEPFLNADYQRLILLFDGRDDEALAAARAQWRLLRDGGATLSYWQETEEGGWRKQA